MLTWNNWFISQIFGEKLFATNNTGHYQGKNANINCDFDEASDRIIVFKTCSRQFGTTTFKLKLIMDVGEGQVNIQRKPLSYYPFITALLDKFWQEIPNGDLDHGVC